MTGEKQDGLREALKRTAVALKQAGIDFALVGSYAGWAHGGPEPDHDVDFAIAEADADRAARALADAGLRVEQPPEDWLFKVFSDGAMVDLVFRLAGTPVEHEMLERSTELEVLSVQMPVLSATDLIGSKLAAMSDHECDFTRILPVARAIREQVDWDRLRGELSEHPYAAAFLFLSDRLGISTPS